MANETYFCRANKYEETNGATRAADFLQRPKGSRSQLLAVSGGEDAAQALLHLSHRPQLGPTQLLCFSEQGSCPSFCASTEAFLILALVLGNKRNKEKMEEIQRTEMVYNWHMRHFKENNTSGSCGREIKAILT